MPGRPIHRPRLQRIALVCGLLLCFSQTASAQHLHQQTGGHPHCVICDYSSDPGAPDGVSQATALPPPCPEQNPSPYSSTISTTRYFAYIERAPPQSS